MDHGLRYLANCSIMFTEVPLLQRPAAARSAGFEAVEFWWPFASAGPADGDVDRFVDAIESAGVRLVGLNFAAGDMPAGDRGLLSWPGREREFLDSVQVAVGIGERLGIAAFNALYGNRQPGMDPLQQDELALANLSLAAAAAVRIGATVLVEPVSGAPRYPLLTADDVVAVMDRVTPGPARDTVRLLADLYHLSVNGDDVADVIARHGARIGHVQIADAPGRHEPGTGGLDLDAWLDLLVLTGYTGWVGLEYNPANATLDGLGWLDPALRARSARSARSA